MRPHLSIYVRDVSVTADFYSKVFGVSPEKQTKSYAKFDLKAPAFNFTVMNDQSGKVSYVGHLGIEVESAEEVLKWKEQMTNLGIPVKEEMNVECCYAKQDKIWFSDPDHNAWEIFYVRKQLDISDNDAKTACDPGKGCCG